MSNPIEYDQPSSAPVPKVAAVAQAGAGVSALVTLLALAGVTVPDDLNSKAQAAVVASQIVVSFLLALVTFVAGYLKKDKKPEQAVNVIQNDQESARG